MLFFVFLFVYMMLWFVIVFTYEVGYALAVLVVICGDFVVVVGWCDFGFWLWIGRVLLMLDLFGSYFVGGAVWLLCGALIWEVVVTVVVGLLAFFAIVLTAFIVGVAIGLASYLL